MKKFSLPVFLVILVAALLRFPLVLQGFFAFTYDQGRDLLAAEDIIVNHHLTLIGPTTGLPGIFYGPWWYYFLSLFFIISKNPVFITSVFAVIGTLTVVAIYFLVKSLSGNQYISLVCAALAAMSQSFLNSSSQLWSPSLVLTLVMIYIYCVNQSFKKANNLIFLVIGLVCALVMDSGAAFGVMLSLSTLVAGIIFRKEFGIRFFLYFFAGFILILLPRVFFDIRHDFLISKSIASWVTNPHIYQLKLTFAQRFLNRIDLLFLNFSQTFSQSNKILALVPLATIIAAISKEGKTLLKNNLYKFLLITIFLIYLGFVLYPDAVWDYYLIGLPMFFLIVFAISANAIFKKSLFVPILLAIVVLVNFNSKLLSPFSITWQGDGAIYRNQIMVMENLKSELHGDYSLYVYTPARFDYPFDYLVWYFASGKLIDSPKENQKRFYLIIRDDNSHSYLSSGWYGDKLKSELIKPLETKEFTGKIITQKFVR